MCHSLYSCILEQLAMNYQGSPSRMFLWFFLSLHPLSPATQLSFPLLESKFRHPSLVSVAMWTSAPRGTRLLTAATAAFPPWPKPEGGCCKPTTCSSSYRLKQRVQVEIKCSRYLHHLRFSTNSDIKFKDNNSSVFPSAVLVPAALTVYCTHGKHKEELSID